MNSNDNDDNNLLHGHALSWLCVFDYHSGRQKLSTKEKERRNSRGRGRRCRVQRRQTGLKKRLNPPQLLFLQVVQVFLGCMYVVIPGICTIIAILTATYFIQVTLLFLEFIIVCVQEICMIIAMLTAISVHYLDQVTSCQITAILPYLALTRTKSKRTMPQASPTSLSLTSSSSKVLIVLMFLAIIQMTTAMEPGSVPPIGSPLAATIAGGSAAIAALHHSSRSKSTEENDDELATILQNANDKANVFTPLKAAENAQRQRHNKKFNEAAFGIDLEGNRIEGVIGQVKGVVHDSASMLKTFDLMDLSERTNLNTAELKRLKEYRKDKNSYDFVKKHAVSVGILPDGSSVKTLHRKEAKNFSLAPAGRIVLPALKIFDAIHEFHSENHFGYERTHRACSKKYYSVTEKMCEIFCKSCATCNEEQPAIKKHKGAKKAILSDEFRDRFQVDLIDMRSLRRRDVYGVMQCWIMTVKDHSTGLTYITSLPRKRASYVAFELSKLFGLIGYPAIFHTDNGKEFTALEILNVLRKMSSNIITVTGRPRTPRDQGSVEVMNKLVKRALMNMISERRAAGDANPNWTLLLGNVMAAVNNQQSRKKDSTTSYKCVFGMDYHQGISCSIAEARQCNTIEQRLKLCADERLQAVASETCNMDENQKMEEVDDGYWSDDSVVADPNEREGEAFPIDASSFERWCADEQTGAYTHTTHQSQSNTSRSLLGSFLAKTLLSTTPLPTALPGAASTTSLAKTGTQQQPPIKVHIPLPDNFGESSSDSNDSTIESGDIVPRMNKDHYDFLSMDDAWNNDLVKKQTIELRSGIGRLSKQYKYLRSWLECSCCFYGMSLVNIMNNEYLNDTETTSRWFDGDFIASFAIMVAHAAHKTAVVGKQRNSLPQYLGCAYPNVKNPALEHCCQLHQDTNTVVSVMHSDSHYAVMSAQINSKLVTIYDGLNFPLSSWKHHVANVLKRCCQIEREAEINFEERHNNILLNTGNIDEVEGEYWKMKCGTTIRQPDGVNCGPIACMKILELFNSVEIDQDTIGVEHYRSIVIDKFKILLQHHNTDFLVHVRKNQYVRKQKAEHNDDDSGGKSEMQKQEADHNVDESGGKSEVRKRKADHNVDESGCYLREADRVREESAESRRKSQASQAKKMEDTFKKSVVASGVAVGAVVTMKVDPRDCSHPRGIIGIVYEANPSGAVKVVTENGVISNNDTALLLPHDQYKVIYKAQESSNIEPGLATIQEQVLLGNFLPDQYKKLCLSRAHQLSVGAITSCRKRKCTCKDGKCGARCGCIKDGIACSSGCSCNGQCQGNKNNNVNM
jgi:hypothetical protein